MDQLIQLLKDCNHKRISSVYKTPLEEIKIDFVNASNWYSGSITVLKTEDGLITYRIFVPQVWFEGAGYLRERLTVYDDMLYICGLIDAFILSYDEPYCAYPIAALEA